MEGNGQKAIPELLEQWIDAVKGVRDERAHERDDHELRSRVERIEQHLGLQAAP